MRDTAVERNTQLPIGNLDIIPALVDAHKFTRATKEDMDLLRVLAGIEGP